MAISTSDPVGPLMPSALSRHDPPSPRAEGYEGERLHELIPSFSNAAEDLRRPSVKVKGGDGVLDLQSGVLQVAPVRPIYTTIEDETTGEHYHPHVHYVFADDDTNSLVHATLDAIIADHPTNVDDGEEENNGSMRPTKARVLIVDMANDGRTVVSAESLSASWQVLDSSVERAPTFNDEAQESRGGTMLQILGRQYPVGSSLESSHPLPSSEHEAYSKTLLGTVDTLAREFEESMTALNRVPDGPA